MRILSIDGGGIRGIIPGQVLVSLEQKLQQITGDPSRRLADFFDLIAGTSTGGILTCLYLCPDPGTGRPKYSAEQAVDLYLQNGDNIFDVSFFRKIGSLGGLTDEKYPADVLETVLHQYLGETRLGELLRPCLVTAYDITNRRAHFFNSRDVALKGSGWDFLLRDVARATSAAPTYFAPANIGALDRKVYPLVDGGVFANNPAMCAYVEALSMDPALKIADLQILSLGTGTVDKPYAYAEARNWGKLEWLGPILDILMGGVADTVGYQLKTLFASAGRADQYLRLQLDLQAYPDVDSAMDNATEKNMRALKQAGQALARTHDADLAAFAQHLLAPG